MINTIALIIRENMLKYRRVFRISVMAVTLSLLITVIMPAQPVLARSISLSKYSGFVGTEIIVTGQGFDAYSHGQVRIFFSDKELKRITVPETGDFTVSINVPSTAIPGETYTISVKDLISNTIASRNFVVAKAIIELDPIEGRVGDAIKVTGRHFDAGERVIIYFSSNKAYVGQNIGSPVVAYEDMRQSQYGVVVIDANGNFDTPFTFKVPETLSHGNVTEDVHNGTYYIYAGYYAGTTLPRIQATAEYSILGGEIELSSAQGQVGTSVDIIGEYFRANQSITVMYDGNVLNTSGGAAATDNEGNLNCAVTIPESVAGNHLIVARDKAGNTAKAEFNVIPMITVEPTTEIIGNVVKVTGYGFGNRVYAGITLNDMDITTTPPYIETNRNGNFNASFIIPTEAVYGTSKLVAVDNDQNTAETLLSIVDSTESGVVSLSIKPETSFNSPGHAGIKLEIKGTMFMADADVTIAIGDSPSDVVAEAVTDGNGDFSATFTVPPLNAGSYVITASDGSNQLSSVFVMESEVPVMPVPLLPEAIGNAEEKAYFDWEDTDDPSGITYVLQVGTDAEFNDIAFEKIGLLDSEYMLTDNEKLQSTGKDTPYYWRVKAVDGAFNEGDWTPPRLFYVGPSQTSIPAWLLYVFYGLGGLVLIFLVFWLIRRRITSG